MTKAQQLGITEFPYREYDSNGKLTYYEGSDGYWVKQEYDSNDNRNYYEDSDGYWFRREFDSNGKTTYYEDSLGKIIGTKSDSKDRIINDQFNNIEQLTERYIEAEKFIMGLNWFERLFISRKVRKFILSRLKYKF